MYGLGISAFNHDSAAVLIADGKVVCALEEERFSLLKHDGGFPHNAIQQCLDFAEISIDDIAYISYYEKPLLRFERIIDSAVRAFPYSLSFFKQATTQWLSNKILVEHNIRKDLRFSGPIYFTPHHQSHAAASYYTSPFEEAAVVTVDGVGEYATTTIWKASGRSLTQLSELHFPNSIGLLYSAFTELLGFKVNHDESKVMGLAAYGEPKYTNDIAKLYTQNKDGSFSIQQKYFAYNYSTNTMVTKHFLKLFGQKRGPEEPLIQKHKDLAASIQHVTETLYLDVLREAHRLTGLPAVCIGGGVALNAKANGLIHSHTPFKKTHVFGPSGDNGAALGTVLSTYYNHYQTTFTAQDPTTLALGTHPPENITSLLSSLSLKYKTFVSPDEKYQSVATLLKENNVIGWFDGKMEFGPRALGQRSILANPSDPTMQQRINRLKKRESFRPFGAAMLEKYVSSYVVCPRSQTSFPYMNTCLSVTALGKKMLPAVTHVDDTIRVQTVSEENESLYRLLVACHHLGLPPALLNTSLNIQGQPIVEKPQDALHLLKAGQLDYLVLNEHLIYRP